MTSACTATLCFQNAGLNIYLVSRTESRLAACAEEIKSTYSVETNFYVADLAAAGDPNDAGACWFGLKKNLGDLDVGVLVNNAGWSYEHPDFLHSLDSSFIGSLIAINATALTHMIQVVLPGMKERGKGCIVNISSGVSSSLPACPLLSVYAATKAYVDSLSASLAAEYAPLGIKVQVRSRLQRALLAGAPDCHDVTQSGRYAQQGCLQGGGGGGGGGGDAIVLVHL